MDTLVAKGRATRLLPEFAPAPTRYDGVWWHVPAASTGGDYVPVPPDLAAQYEDWQTAISAVDALAAAYEAPSGAPGDGAPAGSR